MKLEIIISNYNGRDLLKRHLPKVIKASPSVPITVIDDASSDDSLDFLKQNFPKVKVLSNSTNLGFTKTINVALNQATADFVVLLNNDIDPHPHYLDSALKYFSDPDVFAVSFCEASHSWPEVSWSQGKIQFTHGSDKTLPRYIAWPSGGSSLVRRSHWQQLGGFNEIYSPGYWEDIDLGWRAWKQNLKVIWDPNSHIDHQHESTFKTLDPNFVSNLKQKNELLFIWQNITDRSLAFDHYSHLLSRILKHPGYLKIVVLAMLKYPHLISHRRHNRHNAQLTDRQVLTLINQPLK